MGILFQSNKFCTSPTNSVPVQQIEANVPISLLRAKESRRAKSEAIRSVVTRIKSKHLYLDSDALVQLIEIYFNCWAIEPQFLYNTQLAERTGQIGPIQWGSNIMLLGPRSNFFNAIPTKLVNGVFYGMYLVCLADSYGIFAQLVKLTHILSYLQPKPLYLFRVSQHRSSGVPIWSRWREVAVPILWPVPKAAVTVFSTPDDGCCDTRNMYSDFAVNKYLRNVVSSWILLTYCSTPLHPVSPRSFYYLYPVVASFITWLSPCVFMTKTLQISSLLFLLRAWPILSSLIWSL